MKDMPRLWFENEEGKKWIPDMRLDGPPKPPEGYIYLWSRFPTRLVENCYTDDGSGTTHNVAAGSSSWHPSLVLALMRPTWGEWLRAVVRYGDPGPRYVSMDQAILLAATTCEKCMNRLAHRVGLHWGYRAGSREDTAKTSCEHCEL